MNRHQRRVNSRLRRTSDSLRVETATDGILPGAAKLLKDGLKHHQAGRLTEAEAYYRRILLTQPGHADALHLLGVVADQTARHDLAVEFIRKAIKANRQNASYFSSLGNALRGQGKLDEAVAAHREAIRLKPDYTEAHCNLAAALCDKGKLDEAVAAFRQAIILKPNYADAHNNLGLVLRQLGHLSEARAALEQAIRLAPRNTKYRHNLGEVMHFVAGDPHLAAMEQLARDATSLPADDRIELHFALAKAYDDVGRHADAFRQWLDRNALKRRQIAYDEATTLGALDHARAMFTPELIRTWHNVGNPSSVPVFIVGMARSGSTLVEQILASHPQVYGGGELKYTRRAIEGIRATPGGSVTFKTGEDYRDFGVRYLAEIERLAPGSHAYH